jgi:hypothetical protein
MNSSTGIEPIFNYSFSSNENKIDSLIVNLSLNDSDTNYVNNNNNNNSKKSNENVTNFTIEYKELATIIESHQQSHTTTTDTTFSATTVTSTSSTSTTTTTTTTTSTTSTTTKPYCFNPRVLSPTNKNDFMFETQKCPNISSYFPSYLKVETSLSNGYPINQLIVCNNALTLLKCPHAQHINILSVYYGIQSDTITKCIPINNNNDQIPSFCFNINTFQRVSTLCQNKESCLISITTNSLGEPCFGFGKQIVVQYQCVDTKSLQTIEKCPKDTKLGPICKPLMTNLQKEKIWCEPSLMSIECPRGQVIRILCGFYGIDPNHECPGTFRSGAEPTYCYSNSSYDKLVSECSGKKKCVLSGDPDFVNGAGFTNPCPGYAKILLVQWECIDESLVHHVGAQNELLFASPNDGESPRLPLCELDQAIYCPETSPYVPKFLSNSTSHSIGYPIFEHILCSSGKLVLACPSNLVIHIYGAYYGIQHETSLSQCLITKSNNNNTQNAAEMPKMCFFSNTLSKIQTLCENRASCLIEANVNKLGDPCPRMSKQLFVQYQCMHKQDLNQLKEKCFENKEENSNGEMSKLEDRKIPFVCPLIQNSRNDSENNVIQERTWCDGSTMNIQCGPSSNETTLNNDESLMIINSTSNNRIEILCAFYGIHTSLTSCNIQNLANPPICYSQSSFELVAQTCNNQTVCTIDSFTTTFSDSCLGFDKALYVQWRCIN